MNARNVKMKKNRKLLPTLVSVIFFTSIPLMKAQVNNEVKEADLQEDQKLKKMIDYKTLSHRIVLKLLRSGNHDPSGINNYYFKILIIGLIDTEKEHLLDYKKRKKVEFDYLSFGDIELSTFSKYEAQETDKNIIQAEVNGDAIRELVRNVMNATESKKTFIPEDQVSVLVKVRLMEKNKKYWILDDDKLISELEYFAIPFNSSEEGLYENQKLFKEDAKGLQVMLEVKYSQNLSVVNE